MTHFIWQGRILHCSSFQEDTNSCNGYPDNENDEDEDVVANDREQWLMGRIPAQTKLTAEAFWQWL